jgi:ABC-type arginine/histidine transport system permease subunit
MTISGIFWVLTLVSLSVNLGAIVMDIIEYDRSTGTHKYVPLMKFSAVMAMIFAIMACVIQFLFNLPVY